MMYRNHLRQDLQSLHDEEEKNRYFDVLVEEAIRFCEGGKLYGFQIDITNPRDIIAALYAAYQNKEVMVKPRYAKSDGA